MVQNAWIDQSQRAKNLLNALLLVMKVRAIYREHSFGFAVHGVVLNIREINQLKTNKTLMTGVIELLMSD